MSSINPNTIDGTYPIAGQDNDSQGFRNNFTETKNNFQFAASEITDLQNNAVLKGPLSGTSVDASFNNLNYQPLTAAQIKQQVETKNNLGETASGTVDVDWTSGHFQYFQTGGAVTLNFLTTWPTSLYTKLRIQANVTSVAHTLTLPSTVSINANSIQGYNYLNQTITFASTGVYAFDFTTYDTGTSFTIEDAFRSYDSAESFTSTGNLIIGSGLVNTGYQFSKPTANVAVTGSVNTNRLVLAPTGAIISFGAIVTLPGGNVDGRTYSISSNVATQLQVNASNGTTVTPSGNVTLSAGSQAVYLYYATDTKWYKIS